MKLDLSELVEKCLAPLDGDNPAGINARYEPAYDEVKAEIGKLTVVAAGQEGIDWEHLAANCRELLSRTSKDLNLAAYLALALFMVADYSGLAAGLRVLTGVIDDFWEDAFPPLKRMKARANVFGWVEERVADMVAAREPAPEEAEAVRDCLALAQKLTEQAGQKISDTPVTGLSGLRAALKAQVEKLPAPEPEPAPQPEPEPEKEPAPEAQSQDPQPAPAPEQPPAQAAPASPPPAAPAPPAQVESLDQGLEALQPLVSSLRAADPASPVPYRLARVIKWDRVDSPPQSDAKGNTQIPAPRPEVAQSLKMVAQAANWTALAEAAEDHFLDSFGAFSLDLQRLVAQALENQGAGPAALAVKTETARFVNRLPGIENLKFAGGAPFADPATRQWLMEVKALVAGPGQGDGGGDDDWRKEALSLAAAGDLAGGLARAQQAVEKAAGLAQAMKAKLAGAGLCLDYGQPGWAAPILDSLAREMEKVKLADWQPSFCASVYEGLAKAYQGIVDASQSPQPEDIERLEETRRKLFALDMARAVRLAGSG